MEEVSPKLTFREDGVTYLLPCLDITLYWAGSMFDRIDGILSFYKQSIELIGSGVTYFATEAMSVPRRLKKDTLELLPFWLKGTKTKRDMYMLYLESSSDSESPSDRAFALQADEDAENPLGFVRLMLPTNYFRESAAEFVDLAGRLGQSMIFVHGHAGYSLNWNDLGDHELEVRKAMYSLRNRYLGLDLSDPSTTKFAVPSGIKCVNWLTFLNEAFCERLGGRARLAKTLGKNVVIHTLAHGVMIQAGSAPEIGDVNRRQDISIYHQVGKALAPIRAKSHPAFFGRDGMPSEDATEKWLGRFDS